MTTARHPTTNSILTFLAERAHASLDEIGSALDMKTGEVRARLAHMEGLRLVTSYSIKSAVSPRRVYAVTTDGRRRIEG